MNWLVMRFPPPVFAKRFALRAAVLWAGFRFALLFGGGAPEESTASILLLGPGQLFILLTAVIGVVLIDARRRNEDLFLANLGVSRSAIAGFSTLVALGLEGSTSLLIKILLG